MPSLAGIDGRSLAIDIGAAAQPIAQALGVRNQRKAAEAKQVKLAGLGEQALQAEGDEQARLLSNLIAYDRETGEAMASMLQTRNEQQAVEFKRASKRAAQTATWLKGLPREQQRQGIIRTAQQWQQAGHDVDGLAELLALFDRDHEEFTAELDKTVLLSASTDNLLQMAGLGVEEQGGPLVTLEKDGEQVTSRRDSLETDSLIKRGFTEVKTPASQVTINNAGPFKIPKGFMLKDENDPSQGVVPIPGGPATRQSPGDAAKTQLIEQGKKEVAEFEKMLFDSDGGINRLLLAQMQFRLAGTDGRTAYTLLFDAMESKLRAESGAAVPKEEVERMANRFVPSLFDNDQTIKTKIRLLNEFLTGTGQRIDPESAPVKEEDLPSNTSFEVGQIIERGGKRFRITKLSPDGDHFIEEVK